MITQQKKSNKLKQFSNDFYTLKKSFFAWKGYTKDRNYIYTKMWQFEKLRLARVFESWKNWNLKKQYLDFKILIITKFKIRRAFITIMSLLKKNLIRSDSSSNEG